MKLKKIVPLVLLMIVVSVPIFFVSRMNTGDQRAAASGLSAQFGYPVQDKLAVKTIANFEEGLDSKYDPATHNLAPHFWTTKEPQYNYQHVDVPQVVSWFGEIMPAWNQPDIDNVNWWNTLADKNGRKDGYTDCDYQLNLPGKTNYEDWSNFDTFRVKWFGGNATDNRVNLEVYIRSVTDNKFIKIGYVDGISGQIYTTDFTLSAATKAELTKIDLIRFRVYDKYLSLTRRDYNDWERTHIYDIKVLSHAPVAKSSTNGSLTFTSKYLGNAFYRRNGSYSATGFSDNGVIKMWFGSGIPEDEYADNVYYTTCQNTQYLDCKTPLRTTMNSFGELKPFNSSPGWGGDPSVIMSGNTYVMYFTGVKNTNPFWGRIYRSTSPDGINWTLSPKTPVVDSPTSGVAGYGSGTPSVTFKEGVYYLYYYSQSEEKRGWTYLRTSTDGIHFGSPKPLNKNFGGDVKYVDQLGIWVMTYYKNDNSGVAIATSKDGVTFTPGSQDSLGTADARDILIAQDTSSYINHNPGFIGDKNGHGFTSMYVTYGVNQFPFAGFPYQYHTRQLGLSSVNIFAR